MLKCATCSLEKEENCFYMRSSGNYRKQCKTCWSERNAKYRSNNTLKINEKKKQYYIENSNKVRAKVRQYYTENSKSICRKSSARYKTDLYYALRLKLRNRLNNALTKGYKSGSAVGDLGCTIDQLKQHLESKFKPGMTWENWTRDGWHIDHIVPLSSFDLTDLEQLRKACHYSNLQPLWAIDNIRKGDSRV